MSTINITLSKFDSELDGSIGKAKKCSKSLSSASSIVGNVISRLDREIIYSRNIHNDLNGLSKSIEEIEEKITDIRTFLLNAARQYLEAQEKISKLHKAHKLPYKKNTWIKVGKAVLAIGASAIGVVSAVAVLGSATGAVAVTFAAIGVAFAVNGFITTVAEMFGKDLNILKSTFENIGGFFGSICGNKELGQNIGNFLYNGLNIATAIYTLTKSFTKLSDPKVEAPKMIKQISESKMVKAIANCVTGITNKAVGIVKSSKGLSFIQNNLIMPIKNITLVGANAIKSVLSNPVREIKRIIKPTTDFVVGIAKKCESLKDKKIFKLIPDLKKLTVENSVSTQVGIMQVVFKFIPKNNLSLGKITAIDEGLKATSSLLKLGTSSEKFYRDLVKYAY